MINQKDVRKKRQRVDSRYRNTEAPVQVLHSVEAKPDETMGVLVKVMAAHAKLVFRKNSESKIQSQMLDLDTAEGKMAAQRYLDSISGLIQDLGAEVESRIYRMNYTQSYRRMLPEAQAYLADILDTAQEAHPHMWVNGEKYVFSEHVVTKGIELYQKFQELNQYLPIVKSMTDLFQLKSMLTSFDAQWCVYELAYIGELMVIERDARRFIYELTESKDDSEKFIKAIGNINCVANTQGKGRQDFNPDLL